MLSDTQPHFKYEILAERSHDREEGREMQKSQLLRSTRALPWGHVTHFYRPSLGLKHIFDAFKVQAPPTMKSHQCSAGTRPSGSVHIGLHEPTTISLRLLVSQAFEQLYPTARLDAADWGFNGTAFHLFIAKYLNTDDDGPHKSNISILWYTFNNHTTAIPDRLQDESGPETASLPSAGQHQMLLIEGKWLLNLQLKSR